MIFCSRSGAACSGVHGRNYPFFDVSAKNRKFREKTNFVRMIFARRRYSVSSCRVSVRITRAGFPTATESAGMSRVTTAPAPMTERSPIVTPGHTITPPPSQQWSPTVIGRPRFESSAALCRVERMQER